MDMSGRPVREATGRSDGGRGAGPAGPADGPRLLPEALRMLSVTHLTHVAIRVADIARTLDFYEGKLGFSELMRLDRDGRLWLVYLRITDDQYLEVFPEGVDGPAPAADKVGLNHLCLAVPDIDRAVAELDAAGIPLYRSKTLGADGNWQCWIEDPDGHRIELMQMMPDGMQAKALSARAGR